MTKKTANKKEEPPKTDMKVKDSLPTTECSRKTEGNPVVVGSEPLPQAQSSVIEEVVNSSSQTTSIVADTVPVVEEKEHELLAFIVSGEEYGIDIMMIKEIIRSVAITYVPRVPDYVEGIISLRGTVVPIFDMAKRLGLKRPQSGKRSRIVVITLGTNLVGFLVDSVTEVLKINESSIEPPPPTLTNDMTECISGVAYFKERLIIIMNVEKILGALDLTVQEPVKHTF
jgi:purine-binding chemotaxis protein CheW